MVFDFKKLNDPEYLAEMERKRKEKEDREQQMIDWREITVGATGHRPDKMGGWANALGGYKKDHPFVVKLRVTLLEVLEDLILNQGKTRFVSGGALGFDSMFFWAVNHLKKKYPHIQNVLAIPFENQYIRWQDQQIYWYKKMLEMADEVFDVSRLEEYTTNEHLGENPIPIESFSIKKMHRMNEFMVDQSGIMVAFYDGSSGGTGHCVKYAMNNILHRPVIIRLDPRCDFKPEYY